MTRLMCGDPPADGRLDTEEGEEANDSTILKIQVSLRFPQRACVSVPLPTTVYMVSSTL